MQADRSSVEAEAAGFSRDVETGFNAPKRALLIAAEALFAERTIESVSLREIAAAANSHNTNAVQYHFGSKEGLVQAIFQFRVRQMEGPRTRMLSAMERDGRLRDPRAILEALCLPLLDLKSAAGRHTYAGFLQQYIVRYRPTGVPHPSDRAAKHSKAIRRLRALADQRLAYLPPDLRRMRIGLAHLIFANMLVLSDSDGVAGDPIRFGRRIEDALRMAEAAFVAAPERTRRQRRQRRTTGSDGSAS